MKIEYKITMNQEEKEQVIRAYGQLYGSKFEKDLINNKVPGMSIFLTKDSNNYVFIMDIGDGHDVSTFVAGMLNGVEINKAAEEIINSEHAIK